MRFRELLLASLWLFSPVLAQDDEEPEEPEEPPEPPAPTPTGIDAFANVTIYQPEDAATQVTYGRTENLPNKTVLAAWDDPSQNNTIHIYRSQNSGYSWFTFGSATSSTRGRRLLQPHLLFINETSGEEGEEAGTVLLAVNAVDDKSTNIEVYASYDLGESFELASRVVSGGPVGNATKTVSNPFLVYHDGRVTLYYSDQRDSQHAQKVVQQTTSDWYGRWGSAIDVAISQWPNDQPGLTAATKLPNNRYLLAFQYAIPDATSGTITYPIFYKVVNNPENAGTQRTREIRTDTGVAPKGAPSVTWTPIGGANGTIVLSDSYSNSVFVNQALGEGVWREIKTPAARSWAREVRVPDNDQTKVRIVGGSAVGQQTSSQILLTMMDIESAILD